MSQSKLEAYYRRKRKIDYMQGKAVSGIKSRRIIHNLISFLLRIYRGISGRKITIVANKQTRKNVPIIYACTHVGRYDIETAVEIIPEQCFFLMGDPGEVYRNFDGLLLYLNGVIYFDTAYKDDRFIAKENCVKILEQGGSLLIFPEGAWNISENEVVMKLFPGTVEMAIRTGADIVPIAIEQYGKHYYVNIGRNINSSGCDIKNKQKHTDELRDILCTLKWHIWERFPVTERSELSAHAKQEYIDSVMSQTENGYTIEEINRTKYHRD